MCIYTYICHISFIHASIFRYWSCFHILAIEVMLRWTWKCSYLFDTDFIFFGYVPSSGIAGSYDSSINFLRHFPSVFRGGCANLHSYQQCTWVPFSWQSCQYLLSHLFENRHPNRWHLFMVLICISLMISVVEHLFIYLLTFHMSSFGKVSIQVLCPFLNCFLCCWWWCFFFVCLFWFGLFFATENYTTKY